MITKSNFHNIQSEIFFIYLYNYTQNTINTPQKQRKHFKTADKLHEAAHPQKNQKNILFVLKNI